MIRISFVLLNVFVILVFSGKIPNNLNRKNSYCYATDQDPYKYFASKTAYEFIHGDRIPGRIPKCTPVQFWSLNRHGTRYPGIEALLGLKQLSEIQAEILQNLQNEIPNSQNTLCEEDIEMLRNWQWDSSITDDLASTLHPQGWQDLKLIALRNKARFSELLSLPYSEKDFLFRHTKTERTEASFKAFAEGLFGADAENVKAISYESDTLIQTYKNCKYWLDTVENNPNSSIEFSKFLAGPVFSKMISNVSNRLGFKTNLNQTIIDSMFDMCRFEQAWNVDYKAPWCSVFTKDDLKVKEYAEDLVYYLKIGHGNELNPKVGCMPLKDLMERFQNVIDGKNEPKGIFYFTHSSAMQLSMTAFGMNKDKTPLHSENMEEQKDRIWRTAFIGPFATNLDVILYKCSEGDKYRVSFYLNEKPYHFEGCLDNICSWEVVKKLFSEKAEKCNLDFCQNDNKMPYKVSKWIEEP